MKFLFGIFAILLSSSSIAEDLLKGYDSTKPSHQMSCYTETGVKKYEIIAEQMVIDNIHKFDIKQNEGRIFAGINQTMFGDATFIFDYGKRVVTEKSAFGTFVWECN